MIEEAAYQTGRHTTGHTQVSAQRTRKIPIHNAHCIYMLVTFCKYTLHTPACRCESCQQPCRKYYLQTTCILCTLLRGHKGGSNNSIQTMIWTHNRVCRGGWCWGAETLYLFVTICLSLAACLSNHICFCAKEQAFWIKPINPPCLCPTYTEWSQCNMKNTQLTTSTPPPHTHTQRGSKVSSVGQLHASL